MTQLYQQKELTPNQIKLIKETVPILEQAGETLTAKFYKRMLGGYDEVKPFFNETDQKLLRQPRILAYSLLNYARNIEDLTPLLGFVAQIVSKHVGLQVKAEHYPIVGSCLIETMKEILPAEIATQEFIEAWSIAYGNLAAILIDLEANEFKKEPWNNFKEFKVTRMIEECPEVKSVYFTPVDGGEIAPVKPGQYVCIRWMTPGAKFEKSREYSISQPPRNNEYRISVRKLPGGVVSTYIHEQLKVGDILRVAPPNGNFIYDAEGAKKLTLLCGGIGITPLISIMQAALSNGCEKITLLYSNRTDDSRAFGPFLSDLSKQNPGKLEIIEFFDGAYSGKHSIEGAQVYERAVQTGDLDKYTENGEDVYLLGPRGYMKFIKEYLGKKGTEVKLEYFGPYDP
ncbi:YHB1 [Candida oxycetoniae]|uniref:nitric oxide dioxygenase n=1 Tax=Candida oxycetoniae TaxID=497107 RepID=A0AAI9WYV4_9ASCO|nr:YHB1 [Candida oxycetoniae]KAI3405439.1 YHB1 [Candida oxycetoniae]